MRISAHQLVQQVDRLIVVIDESTGAEHTFMARSIPEYATEWGQAQDQNGLVIDSAHGDIHIKPPDLMAFGFALGYFHGVNDG